MVTTQELLDSLKRDKQNLVSMLNNMGVEANDNETFTSLTPKVGKIVSDPVLQDKSITITENGTTNVVADEGYDGLNNVEVVTNVPSSSGGSELNLFVQEEEPSNKNGIWIKTNEMNAKNVFISNVEIDTDVGWVTEHGKISTARAYAVAEKVGDYLYVFGGKNSSNNPIKSACKYNLLNGTCTAITDVPHNFMAGQIGKVGTDIYIFGGQTGSSNTSYTSNAYKYDTLTDTYTQIASVPTNGLTQGGYVTIGTDIYLVGGITNGFNVQNTIYKYDTLTDTYTKMANMPYTNRVNCPVAIGTDIYIMGGLSDKGYLQVAYKFDTIKNTYTQLKALPFTWAHQVCAEINGEIHIICGFNGKTGIATMYKYNIAEDTYTQLEDGPYTIYNAAHCQEGNTVYIISGQIVGSYRDAVMLYKGGASMTFDKNTVVISTISNDYQTKIINSNNLDMSLTFGNIYTYNKDTEQYINPLRYYGDGNQWLEF